MSSAALLPGFREPVAGSQSSFRAVLDAMARPGRIHCMPALSAPSPLGPAAAAVLLTLADGDTPVWIDPYFSAAQPWLMFHSGAPFSASPANCTFALAAKIPDLGTLSGGTDEAPELSATLILQTEALGSGTPYRLSGPGLLNPKTVRIAGLPADFAQRWQANHALFPRGIDMILCAGDQLAALPRSVNVEVA